MNDISEESWNQTVDAGLKVWEDVVLPMHQEYPDYYSSELPSQEYSNRLLARIIRLNLEKPEK